jgi:hypothetical protein
MKPIALLAPIILCAHHLIAGTPTGPITPAQPPFTIIQLPDEQFAYEGYALASSAPALSNTVSWIIANAAPLNLKAVIMPGDLVNTLTNLGQWTGISNQIATLVAAGVTVYPTPGNHDESDGDFSFYNRYCSRFVTSAAGYTGDSLYPNDKTTACYTNTWSGVNVAVITVRDTFSADQAAWVERMAAKYSNYLAIVVMHEYLNDVGELGRETDDYWHKTHGEAYWEYFKRIPNLTQVMCGHLWQGMFNPTVMWWRHVSVGDAGNVVNETLFNTQADSPRYGTDYVRLYKWEPGLNRIQATTYNTHLAAYVHTNESDFQMAIAASRKPDRFSLAGREDANTGATLEFLQTSNAVFRNKWSIGRGLNNDALEFRFGNLESPQSNRVVAYLDSQGLHSGSTTATGQNPGMSAGPTTNIWIISTGTNQTLSASFSTGPYQSLATGLEFSLPITEIAADALKDRSPNSLPVVMQTWSSSAGGWSSSTIGSNGTCLTNGVNGFSYHNCLSNSLAIGSASSFMGFKQVTLSCWERTTTSQTAFQSSLISKLNGGSDGQWNLCFAAGDALRFRIITTLSGMVDLDANTPAPLTDGAWHHVAATYDGANATLYFDGVPIGTVPCGGDVASAASCTPRIGSYSANAALYAFIGDIDEVNIWSRALSLGEIKMLYTLRNRVPLAATYSGVPGDTLFENHKMSFCVASNTWSSAGAVFPQMPFAPTAGSGRK